MMEIEESGMSFLTDEGNSYYVETSEIFNKIKAKGVKICEYVELKGNKIIFVEAKTSAPNPQSNAADGNEKFENYIQSICAKFVNAATILVAGVFKRRVDIRSDIPKTYTASKLQQWEYRCLLVIKGHRREWLPPVQDALNREFSRNPFWNIWSNFSVQVINEEIARNRGIIK